MKVGIDISSLHQMSKGRGIGFYTQNLIDALKKYTHVEVIILDSHNKQESVDLIHIPFFDFFLPTLKPSRLVPTVITIHDAIPLLFPKHYPPGIKGSINLFRQKMSLKKIKSVITVSEASKKDIVKVFKIPPAKVNIVYSAPAEHFKKLSESEIKKHIAKFNLPREFILYSGGVNWNKNLLTQTEAAIQSGIDLVLVGNGFDQKNNLNHPELKEFKSFLEKYGKNPKVHILGFVTGEELVALMNASRTLMFASRYEGFGLPILEAQACGTPVITSTTSSMVEIAGDGAMLVNPGSAEEIAAALNKILKDNKLESDLIEKGFKNLKRFSWQKTALETVQVYKNALT